MEKLIEPILQEIIGLTHEGILEREFQAMTGEWLTGFIREVDQSPHSLKDWLIAHDSFLSWTKGQGRSLSLQRRQEYLCCCLEGMKDPAGSLPLESILIYFLGQNGVE
jgi:hypothetical protein